MADNFGLKIGVEGEREFIVWRCISRLENTGLFCDARTVPESQIEQVLVAAIKPLILGSGFFMLFFKNR